MTTRLLALAIAEMRAMSHGWPAKCTGMSALVRGERRRSISSGSMFAVSRSMSAKTGFAPVNAMQLADERKVIGEVIASSPGPSPAASAAMCRPAVALATATQYLAPV